MLSFFESNMWLYLFSILGLWWTPISLGPKKWIIPLWFLVINFLVYSASWGKLSYLNPVGPILCIQIFWLSLLFWWIFDWYQGGLEICISQWVRWSVFRLMIGYYLFELYLYEWPNEFLLEFAFYEVLCGMTAPIVSLFYKRKWWCHSFFLGLWVLLGVYSIWKLNIELGAIFLNQNKNLSARSITNYWNHFPEIWIIVFWIPLALVIQSILFFVYVLQYVFKKKNIDG